MAKRHLHPSLIQLPPYWLKYCQPIEYLLARKHKLPRADLKKCAEAFDFCNDEKPFAKTLLTYKSNLWLFRCNQQHFCGDFVIVDMSCQEPSYRDVYAIDLKRGAELKWGGGGAGIQFKNVPTVLPQLYPLISKESPVSKVTGDSRELLEYLGIDPLCL